VGIIDPDCVTLAPTLASGVVLLDARSRVLLVRENDQPRWGLPGGELEPGETPAEAAIREVAEETGLTVELDHLIAVYYLRAQRRGLRFVFAAHVVGGAGPVGSAEIAEVRWFPPDELPDRLLPSAPFAVRDALAGARGMFRDLDATSGRTASLGRN